MTCARVCLGGQPMPPTYASFSLSSTTNNRSIISARGLLLAYFGRSPSPLSLFFFLFFYYVANPTLPRCTPIRLSRGLPYAKVAINKVSPPPFFGRYKPFSIRCAKVPLRGDLDHLFFLKSFFFFSYKSCFFLDQRDWIMEKLS